MSLHLDGDHLLYFAPKWNNVLLETIVTAWKSTFWGIVHNYYHRVIAGRRWKSLETKPTEPIRTTKSRKDHSALYGYVTIPPVH